MSLQKLGSKLEQCSGRFVSVSIQGGIHITYPLIRMFEFVSGQETICFGEREDEHYPFIIHKDTIRNIEFLSEEDEEYVHVCFDVVNDGLTSKIWILCEAEV